MANSTFDMSFKNDNNNDISKFENKGALYKGTNHMGKKIAFEPQRLYNFELQIVGLDTLFTANNPGTGAHLNSSDEDYGVNNNFIHYGSAAERILVACSSFNVPDTTIGQIEIPHYNNTTKYAGKASFGDAQLVIESFLGSFTEQIMTTWAQCVYDPISQHIGFKADYAKDVYVIQYDTKGGTPRIWKMENAWPSVLPGAQWSYDTENRRQLNYTLKCDRCVPDYAIDFRTFNRTFENQATINQINRDAISSEYKIKNDDGTENTGYSLNAGKIGGVNTSWSYTPGEGYVNKDTNESIYQNNNSTSE